MVHGQMNAFFVCFSQRIIELVLHRMFVTPNPDSAMGLQYIVVFV